jgi:hypothetical protein
MVLKRDRRGRRLCKEQSPWPDCPTPDKVRYRSESAARGALRTLADPHSRAAGAPKLPHRAYPCPGCYGWHLTSMKSMEE